MDYDYHRAREIIKSEINVSSMTLSSIYRFALKEIFNNNVKETEKFLLDPNFGGYTTYEIRKVKKNRSKAARFNINKRT